MPGTINVHKQLGKVILKLTRKFGVVDTTGTDENLFRLVPVPGHGARVLPLEYCLCPGTVPKLVLGHQQKAVFRLVPTPRHKARAANPNRALESHYELIQLSVNVLMNIIHEWMEGSVAEWLEALLPCANPRSRL